MITDRAPVEPNRCRCGAPAAFLWLYGPPFCRRCRPRYDPAIAIRLRMDGWPDTADAYRRTLTRRKRDAA